MLLSCQAFPSKLYSYPESCRKIIDLSLIWEYEGAVGFIIFCPLQYEHVDVWVLFPVPEQLEQVVVVVVVFLPVPEQLEQVLVVEPTLPVPEHIVHLTLTVPVPEQLEQVVYLVAITDLPQLAHILLFVWFAHHWYPQTHLQRQSPPQPLHVEQTEAIFPLPLQAAQVEPLVVIVP